MAHPEIPTMPAPTVNPVTHLLDTIGNIWFGVTMLVLIFLYSSLGSALPLVREGYLADYLHLEFLRFEKSEMEWFAWWPFTTLIGLFCLSIIIITLRRIRLTVVNAGVWAIHTGIVLLCAASVYYFGTKIEGDTVIFGSQARIRVPGAPETSMVIRPGADAVIASDTNHYHLQVTKVEPDYIPLSGRFKGERTQQVWINVTSMSPQRNFIRTMLVGDSDNTEDVINGPNGPQRAIKAIGQKLVDPDLQIVLDYDPVQYFYHSHELPVKSDGAIYVRPIGATDWTELKVDSLPHYFEHLSRRDELWSPADGEMPPLRPLQEVARKPAGADWLQGVNVLVTDYLPYAQMDTRFVLAAAGAPLNPMLRLRLGNEKRGQMKELLAADPSRNHDKLMEGFEVRFAWVSSAAERAELVRQRDPRLKVHIESKKIDKEIKLPALKAGTPVAIEGTDYKLEVTRVLDAGQVDANTPAMLLVRVTRGETSFDRAVISGDVSGGRDLDRVMETPADPDIKLDYVDPVSSGLLLVGGADTPQVDVLLTSREGSMQHQQGKVGEAINILPAVPIWIDALLPSVREETRPMIIPEAERQSLRNKGKTPSLLRVEITDAQRTQSAWLQFNEYPFPDPQRNQPGRITPYSSEALALADGRQLEIMYSRQREPLASRVALDRFVLKTHPGGDREADFISYVRFEAPKAADGWSAPVEIRSNQPAQHGQYWYFQSRWDPGTEAHTVLGVGNRNGVGAMLAGVCISIAGMIYAFYVKPTIIRRRKRAALELAAMRAANPKAKSGHESKLLPPTATSKSSKVTRV